MTNFYFYFAFQNFTQKKILHGMRDFSQHLHYVNTGQNTQDIVIEGHTDGMQLN